MAYKDEISALREVSFNSIRGIAKNYIMSLSDEERNELYESLNHGVDLLDSDAQMKCYLFSFGRIGKNLKTKVNRVILKMVIYKIICFFPVTV